MDLEPTEIPALDQEWNTYTHIFSYTQAHNTTVK